MAANDSTGSQAQKTMTANKPEDASILNKRKRENQHPQRKKRAIPLLLKLNCVVEGEATSFPVGISSDKSVGILKEVIKAKKGNAFKDIDADQLTLYKVSIPDEDKTFVESEIVSKEALAPASKELGDIFYSELPKETIHVFVKPPQRAQKRKQDGDSESPSKKARPSICSRSTLRDAITEAGLVTKGIVDGDPNISPLNSKERIKVLSYMGEPSRGSIYYSIISVARELRNSGGIKGSKILADYVISSLPGTDLPVIDAQDLYVRKEFKDLYDLITKQFCNAENNARNRIVVTGTADIGKSSFLVYFAIRLLATSTEDDPPIVIIQQKEDLKCYAFGGSSTVRNGDIKDFTAFLDLPNTWFLVDSSPKPELRKARTIFSVSPNTLFSESNMYKEIVKKVVWTYYMAPWELDELRQCRKMVRTFNIVSEEFMMELYEKIGGVPRYVLEKPANRLHFNEKDLDGARREAYSHVETALDNLNDPLKLLQYFEQAKVSLQYSSPLLHRRPIGDHQQFVLEILQRTS